MPDQKPNDVDQPSPWLEEDEQAHDLARALREGVPAMRRAAENFHYMSPNPGEMEAITVGGGPPSPGSSVGRGAGVTQTLYQRRINRSPLPNPWADTIRSAARLPFRSRIVLTGWDEELAGKLVPLGGTSKAGVDDATPVEHERIPGWVDTLTAEGQSLDEYGAEAFEDALFEGIAYGFVDNDPRTFSSTADRRAAGAQPRVTKFLRRDIRRITLEHRNGVPRLKQVVLKQPIEVTDVSDPNAWVEQCLDARKVVTAGDPDALPKFLPDGTRNPERMVRTQVLVKNDKGDWAEDEKRRGFIIPENPADELLEIPLVPHYASRCGAYRGHSPFLDTAWMEAAVWNHTSELTNLAREATLVFTFQSGVGVDDQQRPILGDTRSARERWSTNPQATFSLHEMQGTALKSVRELIEWQMTLIEDAHHQIRVERPTGPVTAREITLQGVQATSALEMWVIFQEKAWKRILDLVALLGGLPKRGTVSISHDFGLPNAALERLHALFIADKVSPATYFKAAKESGEFDGLNFDFEAEMRWQADNASVPASTPGDPGVQNTAALSKTAAFVES